MEIVILETGAMDDLKGGTSGQSIFTRISQGGTLTQ